MRLARASRYESPKCREPHLGLSRSQRWDVKVGRSAISLRLVFAIARRILSGDRLGLAAASVVAMHSGMWIIRTENASSQRPDVGADSAIDALDTGSRIASDGEHEGLRGSYRDEHCSSRNNGSG